MNVSPPQASAFGFSGPDFLGYNILRQDAKSNFSASTDFTRNERLAQEAFQERMANTAWQRGTKDMLAAGINPMLAFQQGPAHSPAGGQGAIQKREGVTPPGAGGNLQLVTAAQVRRLDAESEKLDAEADETRARTPTHAVTRDQLRQQIAESVARIDDLRASVTERVANAARQAQQQQNLAAELPRIAADTRRILQQMHTLAAEETEIAQRVKANLPELEKVTRTLDIYIQRLQIPGKELDAEVRQSFIGILGSYLKALLPMQGIIGAVPMGKQGQAPKSQPSRRKATPQPPAPPTRAPNTYYPPRNRP